MEGLANGRSTIRSTLANSKDGDDLRRLSAEELRWVSMIKEHTQSCSIHERVGIDSRRIAISRIGMAQFGGHQEYSRRLLLPLGLGR